MKQIFLLTAILILISLPHKGQANTSCEVKDFSNIPAFKERAFLDQKDIGWCVHYTFAALLTQRLGKPVSPIDLALKRNQVVDAVYDKSNFEGARFDELRKVIQNSDSFCDENNYSNFNEATVILRYENRIFQGMQSDSCELKSYVGSGMFKNIKDSYDIADFVFKSPSFSQYIYDLNSKNCKNKIEKPKSLDLEIISSRCAGGLIRCEEKSKEYIRSNIQQDKAVAIIFYPPDLFKNGEGAMKAISNKLKLGSYHAATIVGKYEKEGVCYYKIWDSGFGDKEVCNKVKRSSQINCLDEFFYEVPESMVLSSLTNAAAIKN